VTLSGFEDSEQYTVMSYTLHPHSLFTQLGADGQIHYRDIEPSTPMLYDIAAVQYLYGANMQTRAGDDVYRFSPSKPFLECIWDGGGSDTISVAAFTLGCTVDLRAGHFSDLAILPAPVDMPGWKQPTYDGTDNLSIAYGATIENATGGHGGDMLIGNDAANALRGAGGDDTLSGGPGADRLTGGAGADTFVFDGPAAAGDFVTDFNPGEGDTLQLDGAAFGNLPAEQLLAGSYLVYDGATGKLYYDAGADGLDVTLLAKLAGHPALDAGDIHVT
jgi:Ca2+-binding RTX toxin-like protein